jgi:hypothetical protein
MPQYIWLATGGLNNLKPSEALRDRDVLLLTDLKAEEKWNEKMSAFTPICRSIAISDLLSSIATTEQRDAGLDIADYLLMEDTPPEMALAQWPMRIISIELLTRSKKDLNMTLTAKLIIELFGVATGIA